MNTTNQEQIDYWDKRAGPTWVELQERFLVGTLVDGGFASSRRTVG